MQLAIKKQWSFIQLMKGLISWMRNRPFSTASPAFSLYHTCSSLPIELFINCLVEENLANLIIYGNPPAIALQEAWSKIYEEYIDLIGDAHQKFYIKVSKEYSNLLARYTLLNTSIDVLAHVFHPELAKKITGEIGGNFKFDIKNPVAYMSDIDGLRNRVKSLKIELQLKELELNTLQQSQSGEPVTREYFTTIFINLRAFYKYYVPTTVSVSEFCLMLNDVTKQIEKINSHGSRGKN